MADRGRRSPGRAALTGGAAITVATAVGFDVLAGERPLHTLGLAVVALVVGVLRWWAAGRDRDVLAAVSGAVVAQPALHAASKLLEGPGEVTASTDVLLSLTHIMIAAVAVLTVTTAAHALQLLGSRARLLARRLVSRPHPVRPLATTTVVPTTPRISARHRGDLRGPSRRGPPGRPAVAGLA